MIATYTQVRTEMRTKEAEFAYELRRAKSGEENVLHRLSKLVERFQTRVSRRAGRIG